VTREYVADADCRWRGGSSATGNEGTCTNAYPLPVEPPGMVTVEELEERLTDRLMAHGIYVQSVVEEGGALHVEYETVAPGDGVPGREVGRVINRLRDAREEGWEPTDVHGWVSDEDGTERGTWHAEEGWFHALAEGYISETDFSTLVLSTI